MLYDASRDALYRPHLRDPLAPALFAGKPDALLAELSRLAYFDFAPRTAARLHAALEALGFGVRELIEDPGVDSQAVAVLDGEGRAVVAFRGTESSKRADLLTDALLWPAKWQGGGRVHFGFRRAYQGTPGQGLRERLRAWLDDMRPREVTATGHSLGGALATLFAADHPGVRLVTFGSPRVGTRRFAALFAGREVRRYCDATDLVTRMPPELIGFRHVGPLHYIDRDGKLHAAPPDEFVRADKRAAKAQYKSLRATKRAEVRLRALADHAPVNYVSAALGVRRPTGEA